MQGKSSGKLGAPKEMIDEVSIIGHHHHPEEKEALNFQILYEADWIVNRRRGTVEGAGEGSVDHRNDLKSRPGVRKALFGLIELKMHGHRQRTSSSDIIFLLTLRLNSSKYKLY